MVRCDLPGNRYRTARKINHREAQVESIGWSGSVRRSDACATNIIPGGDSFFSNLDGVCKAGDSVLVLFKERQIP